MPEPQPLKQRLRAWAVAYGGEQLARFGYSSDDRLAATHTTSGDEEADRIEHIVQRLERIGRWKEARVLRAEVFLPDLQEAERLQRLKGFTPDFADTYKKADRGHEECS